jgi:hypothetical protein
VGGTKGSSEQFAKHLDGEESRENNDSVGEVRKLGTRQGIFSQDGGEGGGDLLHFSAVFVRVNLVLYLMRI